MSNENKHCPGCDRKGTLVFRSASGAYAVYECSGCRKTYGSPDVEFGHPVNHGHKPESLEHRMWRKEKGLVKVPTCYISGPMRGLSDDNFPAFDAARDTMRAAGWEVISPADLDREYGLPADPDSAQGAREFVARDIDSLLSLRAEDGDAIVLLKGWSGSVGATAEAYTARWLKLRILFMEGDGTWYDFTLPRPIHD